MSGSRTFIRGTVLSGGGMFIALLGGMAALKLITNTPSLTEADVGVYAMTVALADFLLILAGLGMRSALPKLLGAGAPEDRAGLAATVVQVQLLIAAAFAGLLLLIWRIMAPQAPWLAGTGLSTVYPFLWAVAAMTVFSTVREAALAAHAGLQQYGLRTLGQVAYTLALVALTAGVWFTGGGIAMLLGMAILAHALSAVLLVVPLGLRIPSRQDWQGYTAGLRFARPLYANNVLGFLFARLDTLLVGVFLGPAMAGLFEMGAKKLPQYAVGILNAGLVPFLPSISGRIAQNDLNGAARLLRQTYLAFAFLGYAGVLVTLASASLLVRLLFSEPYLAAVDTLGWMITAGVLTLQAGIIGQALIALGRPHAVTVVNIAMAAISLGLNLVLLPYIGDMRAAGYTAVCAIAVSHVLQAWWAARAGLPIGARAYLAPHAAFAAMVLVMWLGNGSPAVSVAALAGFVALSFVFGVVTPETLRRVAAAFLPER